VDPLARKAIARPWLTLAIDVATRENGCCLRKWRGEIHFLRLGQHVFVESAIRFQPEARRQGGDRRSCKQLGHGHDRITAYPIACLKQYQ
jgi:hypothetical protein